MEALGKYLTKHKKFLLGDDLCYLDFYVFELLSLINYTTGGDVYQEYPHLSDYKHRISELPRLRDYLKSGKCMIAPFNMKFAKINNWPAP